MTISYSFSMKNEAIEAAIPALGKRAASTKRDIHFVACSILYQWANSRDVSTAAKRATEMVSDIDPHYSQGLVNWFSVYAGFDWDKDTKGFRYNETIITAEEYQAARLETFEKLTPPKPPVAFDLPAKIEALIKSAEKRREKGVKDGDTCSVEQIAALRSALTAK